jgi:hypothetical protein
LIDVSLNHPPQQTVEKRGVVCNTLRALQLPVVGGMDSVGGDSVGNGSVVLAGSVYLQLAVDEHNAHVLGSFSAECVGTNRLETFNEASVHRHPALIVSRFRHSLI